MNVVLTTSYIALRFLGIACKSCVTIFSRPIYLCSHMHRASFTNDPICEPGKGQHTLPKYLDRILQNHKKVLFGLSTIRPLGPVYGDLIPSSTIALSPLENHMTLPLPKKANQLMIQPCTSFPSFLWFRKTFRLERVNHQSANETEIRVMVYLLPITLASENWVRIRKTVHAGHVRTVLTGDLAQ